MTEHPRLQLNSHFSNPARLSVMAALAGSDEMDFKTLRDALGLSDSALSKHASALESQGYVRIRKGFVGKRSRTWLSLAPSGRTAFDAHLSALRQLTAGL